MEQGFFTTLKVYIFSLQFYNYSNFSIKPFFLALKEKNLNISLCRFLDNNAEIQGGAIKFTAKTPYLLSNILNNNKAPYGNNLAGYPLRIRIFNKSLEAGEMYKLSEQVSGTILTQSILFEVVDEFEQRINNLAGYYHLIMT